MKWTTSNLLTSMENQQIEDAKTQIGTEWCSTLATEVFSTTIPYDLRMRLRRYTSEYIIQEPSIADAAQDYGCPFPVKS